MKEFIISEAQTEKAVLVGLITPTQSEQKVKECEEQIAKLEEEKAHLEELLSQPEAGGDATLFQKYAAIQQQIAEAEQAWMEAEEELAELQS